MERPPHRQRQVLDLPEPILGAHHMSSFSWTLADASIRVFGRPGLGSHGESNQWKILLRSDPVGFYCLDSSPMEHMMKSSQFNIETNFYG